MTEKFDPIDQGAKYGSEHRMSLADAPGRKNSRRKYANETRRYGTLTGGDLESIQRDIDPRLLDAFRYAFSDARRREVVGDDAACSASSSSRSRGRHRRPRGGSTCVQDPPVYRLQELRTA